MAFAHFSLTISACAGTGAEISKRARGKWRGVQQNTSETKTSSATQKEQHVRICVRRSPASGEVPCVVLQTRVSHFESILSSDSAENTLPRKISLFATLHFGSREYYNKLYKLGAKHDAVCYELVAPRDSFNDQKLIATPVAHTAANSLGLVAQTDVLRPGVNWKRADVNIEDIKERAKHRLYFYSCWEDALKFAAFVVLLPCPEAFCCAWTVPQWAFGTIIAVSKGNFETARRLLYGTRVVVSTKARARVRALPGSDVHARRNEVALEAAKDVRKENVAVVYGAWHAHNIARRIRGELKMRLVESTWVDVAILAKGNALAWAAQRDGAVMENKHVDVDNDDMKLHPPWKELAGVAAVALVYVAFAASDWAHVIAQATDVAREQQNGNSSATESTLPIVMYVIRHAAAYIAIRRWLGVPQEMP